MKKYYFWGILGLWCCLPPIGSSSSYERIVSLNPDFSENIIALGKKDRLVGRTRFCPLAPQAKVIGDLREVDLEEIVKLEPDLVLVSKIGNSRTDAEALTKAGLPVKVMERPVTLDEYAKFILELGKLVEAEPQAKELAERIGQAVRTQRDKASRLSSVKVFIQLDAGPVLYSAGDNTMVGDIIRICGGENIATGWGQDYPGLGEEEVIAAAPEVIVVCVMGKRGRQAARKWEDFPWIPAVAAGRIHLLDPDLFCRLSPSLLSGVELVSGWLHPQEE